MTIFYVLIAILLLGILVTVHEFGHFIAARIAGIDVMEFAIGFGPKLLGWQSRKYETKFSIRAIPMGGYCAFYGEDDAKGTHQDDPRAYARQNVWKRMFSVIMGPMMNFVLAFVVTALYFWLGGMNVVTGVDPYIAQVNAAGPAYEAGLKDNDIITHINGIDMLDGTTDTLLAAIGSWQEGDAPLQLTVQRGSETLSMEMSPRYSEADGRYLIGVTVGGRYRIEKEVVGFGRAITCSFETCVNAGGLVLDALKNMVTTGEGLDQASGPVGVVSLVTEEVRTGGFDAFLNLLVIISINLGVMNLLPIPGLDGSRFLFMVVEAIRRKPIPPQKEAIVHLCGMVFLFLVMILFTFRDVMNLFK